MARYCCSHVVWRRTGVVKHCRLRVHKTVSVKTTSSSTELCACLAELGGAMIIWFSPVGETSRGQILLDTNTAGEDPVITHPRSLAMEGSSALLGIATLGSPRHQSLTILWFENAFWDIPTTGLLVICAEVGVAVPKQLSWQAILIVLCSNFLADDMM